MVIKKKERSGLFICLSLLLTACGNPPIGSSNSISLNEHGDPLLFEILDDSLTKISFNNRIDENALMNGFNYEYLYNGAGVSVADLNGDDLPDLYFTANLVDNELYLNQGDLIFEKVTQRAGVEGGYGFHQGTTMVDINHDGRLDIYLCKSGIFEDPGKRKNELYVNQGNDSLGIPIFKEEARQYGLDLPHYSTQAAFLDYDKDGDLDMFLLNHNTQVREVQENMERLRFVKSEYTSDRLFRNDNGRYVDISDMAGIINDGIGFGLGIAIGDVNNDNWPDMIVGHDYTAKDRMYINQRDGTFRETMNRSTGHIPTFSMGNDIADFNNDGWLDFISVDMVSEDNYGIKASMSGMNPEQFNYLVDEGFHHQYMYNTVQLNNGVPNLEGDPLFSDIAFFAGASSTDWSWGPLLFDMDNDGDRDLFISNGIKRDFRNVDYVKYKKAKEQEFVQKMEKAPGPLKETLKKMFIAEMLQNMPARKKHNYFFENLGNLEFSKKNQVWALDKFTAANGAAYADLDNDGDLDIITNNMDDKAFVYRNNSMELGTGNYIRFKLEGPKKNRDGIGARVRIRTKEGIQMAEQYMTRGFQSSIDRILHFGLGGAETIHELKITWPDGLSQVLTDIGSNQTLTLEYGKASMARQKKQSTVKSHFRDISDRVALDRSSRENEFNDFLREALMPHRMSEEGPALATGDVNADGLEDFFIGGAMGESGKIYLQLQSGKFKPLDMASFRRDRQYEDVGAVFFDADNDDDLDLYVVSGGNESKLGSGNYEDRIYRNTNGSFDRVVRPFVDGVATSGSVVRPFDYDGDGDLDLFVGGRQIPGKYPYPATSLLLRNNSGKGKLQFVNTRADWLKDLGMVTDAKWSDMDGDGSGDLIIVGEWMSPKIFRNTKTGFLDVSEASGLNHLTGWWFSVETADFDKDGDMDMVAGNLGLNSKYRASPTEPFQIYAKDFDGTGSMDIVLGYHQEGDLFPLRGRECSSNQMPFIKEKFHTYHDFASASLEEVYGAENLGTALSYGATNFSSSYFENLGSGFFEQRELPRPAQLTAITKTIVEDVDADGNLDMIVLGNMYGFEVETPRQDAGLGLLLLGTGKGTFDPSMAFDSGLYIVGEVADADLVKGADGKEVLVVAKKKDRMQFVQINKIGK